MVLGVCNAAGVVLDPLIILKAKNIQSSWYGDQTLPNTYYRKSENGTSYFRFYYNNNACFQHKININTSCMKNYMFKVMDSLGEYLTNVLFLCN